jgi:cell division protein FtsA
VNETILAIDIGSTKISAIIAELNDGALQITGHGICKSQGIKKGVITNIELASKSIKKALNDARRVAGSSISMATVSISNAYAKSLNSTSVINIPHKDISLKEINRVMQTALYNASIPNEYDVIHVLPYNFKVDDQDFIEDPYGMNASRMEVDVNIIMTQKSNLRNLKKAVRSAGVDIEGVVLNGYASAIATMNEDEKELGVAVIDMGGQTSNLIVHTGNSVRYNDFLGVGSNHITNDLSMALHTPAAIAENVKIHYGNLSEANQEYIALPEMGNEEQNNEVSTEIIHSVIYSRVEETLGLLAKSLEKSALIEQVGGGIILTGGMTKLKGIRELTHAIFEGLPVRVAAPKNIGGLFEELKDQAFSTVIGLLLYRNGEHTEYEIDSRAKLLHSKSQTMDDLSDIHIGMSHHLFAEHSEQANASEGMDAELATLQAHARTSGTAQDSTPGHFVFEDLPGPGKPQLSFFKRISNWAKQLF